MKENLEKIIELESSIIGVYNIITRSDLSNGEVYELVEYQNEYMT